MRALVIYCHPNPNSFTAAIRDTVLAGLAERGAEARLSDLYAQQFDPRLSESELAAYDDSPANQAPVADHVADLLWADTLIFVYPTWWYGLPAMLKGWLDRVLLPEIAFHMPKGDGDDITPGLTHIKHLQVFTTCGASRLLTAWVGAPGKRTLTKGIKLVCGRRCRTGFRAHYLMDSSTPATRALHLSKVRRDIAKL